MKNKIDLDIARELAGDLAGSLEHLSLMNATIAALDPHGKDYALLAATFSTLHGQAARLSKLLEGHA